MKDFNSRWAAYQVLNRLEKRKGNSSTLLQETLSSVIDSKDRSFITDLVLGTLRWRARLLFLISQLSSRRLHQLDREVVLILQLGVYQLLYTNIPHHAAIYETVKLCKIARLTSAASFVNGILRGIQGRLNSLPEPKENPLPIRWSHPEWLSDRWVKRFGESDAVALMQINNQPPPVYLHINSLLTNPAEVVEHLHSEGVTVEETNFGPSVLRVRDGSAQNTKSFLDGEFYIQDAAIHRLAEFLVPLAGPEILEIAAAPGGKTFQLLIRKQGRIVATDSAITRMKTWRKNMERMKLANADPVVADARSLPFLKQFDVVLIDAPCSSLGVIRRHPEIKWWIQETNLGEKATLQLQILNACAKYVRSQGELIYSVCSFEPEETQQVRDGFLTAQTEFSIVEEMTLLPHRDHTDGFYALKLRRIV